LEKLLHAKGLFKHEFVTLVGLLESEIMRIYPIETGNFKLDGGAMFGVVPKSIWSRTNVPDDNNMCDWSMRCMLVEYSDRLVLIDTGMGDKQSEKFFGYYYLFGEATLKSSIEKLGFGLDEITDVVLTHLHFDHCGGAVNYNKAKDRHETAFPNAKYWSNEQHWNWAVNPNPREKASFLTENILPIQESGQLNFIQRDGNWSKQELFPGFRLFFADGHTESQMLPYISYRDKTVVFAADLLPSASHIPMPFVMGYDVRPLETMKEKAIVLNAAAGENHILFFEHDIQRESALVEATEKGVRLKHSGTFEDMLTA
jgi:glyoxylase-like metal-dependent hydrolase (beta-lactamase superfamily II)